MEDIQGYTMLVLVGVISVLLVRAIFSKGQTKARLPPSPLALPIIGHLHLLRPIPHQALYKLSNRYGPLFHIFLGSVPCIVVSSSETAKEFLKTHENLFHNRPSSKASRYLTYGAEDFVFAPYGPYWRFMRKLCMSELLSVRTLDRFRPVRNEETEAFLKSVLQKSCTKEPVIIREELTKLTNNIISRMSMSKTNDEAGELRNLAQEVSKLLGEFNLSDYIWFLKNVDIQGFGPRVRKVHERLDAIMEKIMKEHEEARAQKKKIDKWGDDRKDVLDLLLDIMEDETLEMRLGKDNIKAFILEMFITGTNGPASAIEWALALLITHKDKFKKAREEIDSVVGNNRLVEESDLPSLPYLQAIVKEALRLHPTGPYIARQSADWCKIGGYDIPANAILIVNVWAIQRDPNTWENPLAFHPERFIAKEVDVRGLHYEMIPFGSGRRGCPGIYLSLLLVQATLARMIQCFDWIVKDGKNGSIDMTEGGGLTLIMAKPLVCIPKARFIPFASA